MFTSVTSDTATPASIADGGGPAVEPAGWHVPDVAVVPSPALPRWPAGTVPPAPEATSNKAVTRTSPRAAPEEPVRQAAPRRTDDSAVGVSSAGIATGAAAVRL